MDTWLISKDTWLISKISGTSLTSDMGSHYLKHLGHVHVGATLTSNKLLHVKKKVSVHYVTKG